MICIWTKFHVLAGHTSALPPYGRQERQPMDLLMVVELVWQAFSRTRPGGSTEIPATHIAVRMLSLLCVALGFDS